MKFLISFLILMFCFEGLAEKVYVFYPALARSHSIEESLKKDLKDYEVLVFGRFNDFSKRVIQDSPEWILTKGFTFQQFPEYSILLRGVRENNVEEKYVFLFEEGFFDGTITSNTTVGVLEILSKRGLITWVDEFLSPAPILRKVGKVEDLLTLLTLDFASVVIVSEYYAEYFKKISQIKLKTVPIQKMKSEILIVGSKEKNNQFVLDIKKVSLETKQMLEINDWLENS